MRNKIKNVGFIGAIDFGSTTLHLELIINHPIERGVMIAGRSIGRTAAIERVKKAMEEMQVVFVSPSQEQIQSDFNHLSGFDILPMRFASLPQIDPELIEVAKKMKNEKRKPIDEPKSKYINRPIKNYRR